MSWVTENLQNALDTWNEKLGEIWQLLMQSPETFRGGSIWTAILDIHDMLQAIGYALLILFFLAGVMKTCGSLSELKRPEQAVRLFIRFILAKGAMTYGTEILVGILSVIQGIMGDIMESTGVGQASGLILPQEIVDAIEEVGFLESIPLWFVTLLGGLVVTVISFLLILTVYGRFFKVYLYMAIAPLPIAAFAGEPTQNIGKSYLRSFIGVGMEGVIILLSCVIYSIFAASPPTVDVTAGAIPMIWSYIGELIFNMLVLVGTVKVADHLRKDMLGL